MSENDERFLARWSRLKRTGADAQAADPPPAPGAPDANAPLPDLPPLDKLTIDSDYSGFFHPKVDAKLRQAALRKLFSDPRFNVMDGLDVYIDDYSRNDPLPAAMLAELRQGQKILAWAREDTEKSAAEEAAAALRPGPIEALPPQAAIPAVPVAAGTLGDDREPAPRAVPAGDTSPSRTISLESGHD